MIPEWLFLDTGYCFWLPGISKAEQEDKLIDSFKGMSKQIT